MELEASRAAKSSLIKDAPKVEGGMWNAFSKKKKKSEREFQWSILTVGSNSLWSSFYKKKIGRSQKLDCDRKDRRF